MGLLFGDDPAYPDHRPVPTFAGVDSRTFVIGAVIVTVVVSHHPMIRESHAHVPYQNYVEDTRPIVSYAVSSSSSGDHLITLPTGQLSFSGLVPNPVVTSSSDSDW